MAGKKKSSGGIPKKPNVVITMSRQPEYNSFTRYLSFKNHSGDWKRLAIAFRKKSMVKKGTLIWESHDFPDGIDVLKSFVHTGNRSYWDKMYLENRGGRTALPILHLLIEMNYNKPTWGSEKIKIPIVDANINTILRSGWHCFSLNSYANYSRYKCAGLSNNERSLLRQVAQDLGKSGSDGVGDDKYGKNPKY